MAALWNRAGHHIFILSFVLSSFFFPRLISVVADWMCDIFPHMHLKFALRPYMVWRPLVRIWDAGLKDAARGSLRSDFFTPAVPVTVTVTVTGRKNSPKNRHLGTIAQICRAISSQLRHVLTIGKTLVKQQYLAHMSSQYGELRPTSGWDRSGSLEHATNFNGFRVLAALLHGTLVVGVS